MDFAFSDGDAFEDGGGFFFDPGAEKGDFGRSVF